MGDFAVSCGVSRMSINGGDKCAIIPIVKTKHSDSMSVGAYYVSNDGPLGRYHPFTLPIFGEYNSYGTLDEIEEDCNTKAIEQFYGHPIKDFVQHICNSHHSDIENGNKFPKEPCGMFVKREVYDNLKTHIFSEFGEKENVFTAGDLDAFVLRYLGFVEDKTVKRDSKERYNRLFKHEQIPNLNVWSDGTWTRYQIGNNKRVNDSIYHPDDLCKFLKKHKFFVMTDKFEAMKKMRTGEMAYDKDCERILKLIENDKRMLEPVEGVDAQKLLEYARALAGAGEYMSGVYFLKLGNWASDNKGFRTLYGELFKDSTFRKQMIDYKTFEHQLWFVNAPLMPSWCGIQYGCHTAELRLAKLTEKLCKAKIEQYKKDCDD